jgi:SAM-dependent methyltransferase
MSHQHAHEHATHQHGAHEHGAHEHGGPDEEALTELLDLDGEVLAGYLDQATAWIAATAEPPVTRVVDLGAGTGTGTFALLRRFPEARVTAVDLAPDRLTRLRHRACELGLDGRVDVVAADLDQAWPELGPADLAWPSMALHHVADPDQALTRILGRLRPGGALVVAETSALESFPRFLPAGAESGLEDRLHHLLVSRLGQQVPELGADWGARLTAAGFDVTASRTFAVTLEPPLPPQAGRYAQLTLDRLRSGLGDGLDPADQQALAALVADEGPDSVRHRADLTVRATRLAWLARRP